MLNVSVINTIVTGETSNALRLRIWQGCLLLPRLFSIVLEAPASEIKQEKGIKGTQIEKEEIRLSLFTNDMVEKPKESIKK